MPAKMGVGDDNDRLRVLQCQELRDWTAAVPPMGSKTPVAELFGHQLCPQAGAAIVRRPALVRTVGEAKPWYGRYDHIERVGRVAPVAGGISQHRNDFVQTKEGI